jgi:membrane-associated protease RseP (regulator of RpoE activity)
MTTAILAIILFCVMIFPHELGHFIAARAMGIKVNEFAFGMGPVIWKKQGEEIEELTATIERVKERAFLDFLSYQTS